MVLGPNFAATLTAAQDGDEWAWRALYGELSGRLLGYLRSQGAHDAENLLGEVFLQIARSLEGFEGSEGAFRGWAFMIARNRIVDERRAAARRPEERSGGEPPERLADTDVEHEALARAGLSAVGEAVAHLTSDQREVLLLRVIGDLPLEEVARIVGKRPGAVKQLQRRALATLRRELEIERGAVTP